MIINITVDMIITYILWYKIIMIINKALYNYGYSAFNLTIIEHIDVSNLSKNETKVLILERE